MSSAPTDPGDEPLSEEGFYQVKARQQPTPNENLAPQSGRGTGGPAGQGIPLVGGQPSPTPYPPQQGDTVLPDTGRFGHFIRPKDFGDLPYAYEPDKPAPAPNPGHDYIQMPPYSEKPNYIRPQPEYEGKYGGKFNASASDNPGNDGDVSNQPLTEDGFKQLLAKSTNVPSQGGPDPSQLEAYVDLSNLRHGSFGYIGDASPDHYSLQGTGKYNEHMTTGDQNGIRSVGGSLGFQEKHGIKPGQVFTYNGQLLRLDDTNDSRDPKYDDYIDFYEPNHPPDKGHENDANKVIHGKTEAEWFSMRSGGSESGGTTTAGTTGSKAGGSSAGTEAQQPQAEEEEEEKPKEKPKQAAEPYKEKEEPVQENQPVAEHEDEEVGYPAWSVRGGMMSPQQQAQLEAVQRRPATQAGQVTSENPILANILAKIYEQYGGA